MPGIGIHAARTGRGCSYALLLLTTALLLLCFCAFLHALCALHHTDIQLLRAPKFASSSTVTNSYTSIGTRARTHMCTLHTDQLVEENAAQTTGRKLCNLALPCTHTHTQPHTHTHTYTHTHLCALLPFSTVFALCLFSVLFLQIAQFAFCTKSIVHIIVRIVSCVALASAVCAECRQPRVYVRI